MSAEIAESSSPVSVRYSDKRSKKDNVHMPKRDAESIFLATSSIFPRALSAKGSLEEVDPLSAVNLSAAESGRAGVEKYLSKSPGENR
jgi:hypothetical protein